MKKVTRKTLQLKTETIRALRDGQLEEVIGGAYSQYCQIPGGSAKLTCGAASCACA